MKLRKDEDFARRAFHRLLTGVGFTALRWRRASDPPDLYLRTGASSYAVEVTQVMEDVDVGTHRVSERGALKALEAIETEVEKRALEAGVLEGTYALDLVPIHDLRRHREAVVNAALDYIGATKQLSTAPRHDLAPYHQLRRCTIEKIGHVNRIVGASFSIEGAKWQSDVLEDLQALLARAIQRKTEPLRRVRLPKVLLLVDAYHYGDRSHWASSVPPYALETFHTIARTF